MILVFMILLIASFAYYVFFLWKVSRGLEILRSPGTEVEVSVSVVIAARNEERTLEQCLRSLLEQDFPPAAYEIILVDDHSTDRTAEIARLFAGHEKGVKLSLVSLSEQANAGGKPRAIARGVQVARGDIILCTDADCVAPHRWIQSMVSSFTPSVAFVAGPVREIPGESFLSRLSSLEFLGLITTSAGLIGYGKPIICNGANIAYTRSAFAQVSGFGDLESSCDDETLMQRILIRNVGRVRFNPDPNATITTSSPTSLREFWRQRTRWGAKRARYENASLLWQLILLYSFFAIAFLAAPLSLIAPTLWLVLAPTLLVKLVLDLLLLRKGARITREDISIPHFLIAELLHLPYIAVAGLVGQFTSIRWKGRTLET